MKQKLIWRKRTETEKVLGNTKQRVKVTAQLDCRAKKVRKNLWASRLSSLSEPLPSRYLSVILWKFSDTDPKQTSGLNKLRVGSGQRDDFLMYLDLLDSSRECHCCKTWGQMIRLGQNTTVHWIFMYLHYTLSIKIPDVRQQFGHMHEDLYFVLPVSVWPTSSGRRSGRLLTHYNTNTSLSNSWILLIILMIPFM